MANYHQWCLAGLSCWEGRVSSGDVTGDGVVAGRVMSGAERQARYRARRRAEREAAGVARREATGTRFMAGNDASLVHGAFSAGSVDELAGVIERDLLAQPECAYLRSAVWLPMVRSWCSGQAQLSLLRAWLSRITIEAAGSETVTLDETESRTRGGKSQRHVASQRVEPVLQLIDRVERRLIQLSKQLGLDPRSRSQLGKNVGRSFDMAQYVAGVAAAELNGTEEPDLPDIEQIGLAAFLQANQAAQEIVERSRRLPPAG
jgi:hypothetical protein